jgi:hypothetical protein
MKPKVVLIVLLGVLPRVFGQEIEGAPAGKVVTARKTVLQTKAKPSGHIVQPLAPGTELRWIMGQKSNGFVRVMVPKGPSGWVPENALDNDKTQAPPAASIELGATAQPCQASLDACPERGCAGAGTPHALANATKKRPPIGTEPIVLSFQDFASLQQQATDLVDMGQELDAGQRAHLADLQVAAGAVQEGSLVRVMAGLSDGTPHPNSGESVNCNRHEPENNDFHISVTATPGDTEFNGIVVEMIPQDRPAAWTIKRLKNLKGKMLLIDGALFYDNLHFINSDADNPLQGQPKRFSLWEIHPVTSVKVCKVQASQCKPDRPSQWADF